MKKYLCIVTNLCIGGTKPKIIFAENKRMARFLAVDDRFEDLKSIEEVK